MTTPPIEPQPADDYTVTPAEPVVKPVEEKDPLDGTPVTFDELLEAGGEAVSRIKTGIFNPVWRTVRQYKRAARRAVDSRIDGVDEQKPKAGDE